MPGLGEFLVGSLPIAGGAVLGALAGNFAGTVNTPDIRDQIDRDLDLIDRLPENDTERRAALRRSVDARVDELVAGSYRKASLRKAALSYRGNWRDIVVLVCVAMLTVAWWNEDHDRSQWLPTFLVFIVLCTLAFTYATLGIARAVKTAMRSHNPQEKT